MSKPTRRVQVVSEPRRLPLADRAPVERSDALRNRAKILEAARKLLKKRSIDAICMDELARVAGVGKGTLYRRFTDRSSLCLALLDDNERELQNFVLRGYGCEREREPGSLLRSYIAALLDFAIENAPLLAEAGASKRSCMWESPVYAWRRIEFLRLYRLAFGERADAVTTADFVLTTFDPEDILWHLRQGEDPVSLRSRYLGFWYGVFAAIPKPT